MKRRLAALILLCLPLPAAAQRVVVTPTVGVYVPLRDQGRWPLVESIDGGPEGPFSHVVSDGVALDLAVSHGVKVAVGWGRRLAVETSIASAGVVRRTRSGDELADARSTVAAWRLLLRHRLGAQSELAIGAGPVLTILSGSGYESHRVHDRAIWGGSLTTTLALSLTPRSRFEIGVADHIYRVEFRELQCCRRAWFGQHDIVVSTGVGLVLGR